MTRLDRLLALVALALVLACVAPVAAAQGTCAPADLKGGTGTVAEVEVNTKGIAAGWWCPGATAPRMVAVTWTKLVSTPALAKAVLELRFAANPGNAIVVLEREFRDTPWAELQAVWGPLEPRMAASKPAAEAWVVAPAIASANPPGTRPTYTYTAPATIRLDGGRVAQGAPCDCALARYQSPQVYCSVQGSATKVAVCVRQ
jgi:hypothetical protein